MAQVGQQLPFANVCFRASQPAARMSAAADGDKLADMGRKERRPLDLDSSKIQRAIGGIEPYPYFEALADKPGAVVLRAKEPVSRWQGLHVAASAHWRARFTEVL